MSFVDQLFRNIYPNLFLDSQTSGIFVQCRSFENFVDVFVFKKNWGLNLVGGQEVILTLRRKTKLTSCRPGASFIDFRQISALSLQRTIQHMLTHLSTTYDIK